MYRKTKVVLGQLGSPKSTSTKDVREYLKEFLGDPRVVDINPTIWKIILNLFVLPFRPKKSAKAYARIEENGKFPLIENTKNFTTKVAAMADQNVEVEHCFLLSEPRVGDVIDCWEEEDIDARADRLVVMPQFPQYSESTVASVYDQIGKDISNRVNIPSVQVVSCYHKLKSFIDLSVKKIQESLDRDNPDQLLISFHGIPLRRVLQKKDEYYFQCYETFVLIRERLNFPQEKIHMVFQSRFGSEQWLGPATDEYAVELIKNGSKHLACYCPSFVVDCLETTDEIGNELREEIEDVGGKLSFIECLNDDDDWAQGYAKFINTYCNGSSNELDDLFYQTNEKELRASLPEQKQESPPLGNEAKKNIKIVFLTLFIDLVGFSIIFPMFPALAKFYLANDGDNFFLKALFGALGSFGEIGGANMNSVALFGGILGALYSLLQFFAAPFWGKLSDQIGRRPVMLISLTGLFLSYVLWIFSGSFTLLLGARVLGGLMAGNLSAATAIVADVTTPQNRSKGMAFVGIAFALGFIFGPAIGGILSQLDLSTYNPEWIRLGINPFSVPAIFAALLCLINLGFVFTKYKETLREKAANRSSNPLRLLKPLPFKGVNQTNLGYFLFITLFSGMEFTLTFLAVERLSYTPLDNAYMFVFIGVLIALIQGGYVRRKASKVGEKRMATQGLITIIPGLLIVAFAKSGLALYAGLFFLATGSAMVIPTLTSLVSLYTPSNSQGQALGLFRSFGALGRVFGPIIASIMYWQSGSAAPYIMGAILLFIPVLIIAKLPAVKEASE